MIHFFRMSLICILFVSQLAHSKQELIWWHSMSGGLGKELEKVVEKYNQSQSTYQVKPIYRGNYTESLNASIAAFRGGKQPHMIQVFEVGTMTMMKSGVIVPVQDLLEKNGYQINWSDYLTPVLSYYQDDQGRLLSMPFNSSTPLMFYNEDHLKKMGIEQPPETWEELLTLSQKSVSSKTSQCGLVVGWQPWVLIENFLAIHNLPFADQKNGFQGMSQKMFFTHPEVVDLITQLKSMQSSKAFVYEGRRSDPSRNVFAAGKCTFLLDSSSSMNAVKKMSKFSWKVAKLPYLKKVKPMNSIIGGATIWVFQGKSEAENKGVAHFIHYLSQLQVQADWHSQTGYLPLSRKAYEKLKAEGFYIKEPFQEVAIQQLLRSEPTENSKGLRLGYFVQIRDIVDEEFERIWAGTKSPTEGLKDAEKRSELMLKKFRAVQGVN